MPRAGHRAGGEFSGAHHLSRRAEEILSSDPVELLLDTVRIPTASGDRLAERWRAAAPRGLVELALHEGVAPWLYHRLGKLGVIEAMPAELVARLRANALEAALLSLRVEEEAGIVLGLLREAGIPAILLKGAARRVARDPYSYGELRPTSDLDLLIPPNRGEEALAVLRARGYGGPGRQAPAPRDHHHLPAMWREQGVSVELHVSISRTVPPAIAWARMHRDARALELHGQTALVPSPTELAWHIIAHAPTAPALGFRLRELLDLASLLGPGDAIDWEALDARLGQGEATDEDGSPVPESLLRRWLDGVGSLCREGIFPEWLRTEALDLSPLLRWRLAVLSRRRYLGPRLAERLLAEGARSAAGLGVESPPPYGTQFGRLRRRMLSGLSRVAFQVYRAGIGAPGG